MHRLRVAACAIAIAPITIGAHAVGRLRTVYDRKVLHRHDVMVHMDTENIQVFCFPRC
jgi:hypothetical protein